MMWCNMNPLPLLYTEQQHELLKEKFIYGYKQLQKVFLWTGCVLCLTDWSSLLWSFWHI